MVKCESLRINMFRITHTGKSVNFPVTACSVNQSHVHGILFDYTNSRSAKLAHKVILPENICIKDISRRENIKNREKDSLF